MFARFCKTICVIKRLTFLGLSSKKTNLMPLRRLAASAKRMWRVMPLLALAFVAGWFVVVRIVSPWHVVKTIEIQTAEDYPVNSNKTQENLRVGCYNIAHGRGGKLGSSNWDGGDRAAKLERLKRIAELLKNADLDIVVLNEADFSSFWSGHTDQARLIAREAGYRYIVEQRNIDAAIPFVSLRFGNAILSRLPLSDATFLDYPHPSRLQALLMGGVKDGAAATVTLPDGRKFQVVAVHLPLGGETYRHSSAKLFMDLQRQSSLPMIAMGDFNSTAKGWPGHDADATGHNCVETLLESDRWSTFFERATVNAECFTFPSEKPSRRIDWIFVSSPWRLQDKTVVPSDLSDHLPIISTIVMLPFKGSKTNGQR